MLKSEYIELVYWVSYETNTERLFNLYVHHQPLLQPCPNKRPQRNRRTIDQWLSVATLWMIFLNSRRLIYIEMYMAANISCSIWWVKWNIESPLNRVLLLNKRGADTSITMFLWSTCFRSTFSRSTVSNATFLQAIPS